MQVIERKKINFPFQLKSKPKKWLNGSRASSLSSERIFDTESSWKFIFLECTHKTRGAKEAIVIFFVWACAIWVRAIWHFLHTFARHQPTCFDGIRGEIVEICTHFYHNWDGMSVTRNAWCKVHSRVHVRHFILPKMQTTTKHTREKKDFTKQSHRARSYSLVILSHTDAQSGCAKAARRVGEFELSKISVRFYVTHTFFSFNKSHSLINVHSHFHCKL